MRQRPHARAHGRHQLDHGRHPGRHRPGTGAGSGGRASRQPDPHRPVPPPHGHWRGAGGHQSVRDHGTGAGGHWLRWFPHRPGSGTGKGRLPRHRHLQRGGIHDLRFGVLQGRRHSRSGHEAAWVKVEPSGVVRAAVGIAATGQGYETAYAQAVAEGLGVEPAMSGSRSATTDVAPYGMGSRGARGGTAGGGTAYLAGRAAQEKAIAIAAGLLGHNTPDQLCLRGGRVWRCVEDDWRRPI